jgi:nitronate monooxygenase
MKRRKFLTLSTISAASLLAANSISMAQILTSTTENTVLRTRLCDVLKIKHPVLQAPMATVVGPELVAKVSEAGGLGILAGTLLPPDDLRSRIRQIRQLTSKPFGVNLIWHDDLLTPPDAKSIPDQQVKQVGSILNQFRKELNIPEQTQAPPEVPNLLHAALEIILEENVPVFSVGLGNPSADVVKRCHDKGIKVIAMIATVEDAKTVAASGVDVIVAQGSEAGGHRSTWKKRESKEAAAIGTLALVPQVVNAVQQPVVAAGGITDGRGLAAALALGATGALVGTRFIATKESMAPPFYKEALLNTSNDHTIITDVFSGGYARVIKNKFTTNYEKQNGATFPIFVQYLATQDIYKAAIEKNDPSFYTLFAGQGIGSFHDIPTASEVVTSITEQAKAIISGLQKNINQE